MAPKSDTTLAFSIEGTRYEVDLEDLEFGEVELLEEAFDLPLDQIDLTRIKAVRILLYLAMRRRDPTVTMDRVAGLKVTSFKPEDDEPARPTKKASAKAAK